MWVNRLWQCLKNYSRENKHCHKQTVSSYLQLKFTRDDFLSQWNCWRSLSSKLSLGQPTEAASSVCHRASVQGQWLLVTSQFSQVNQAQLEGLPGLCSRKQNAAVFCFQRACSSKVVLWLPGFFHSFHLPCTKVMHCYAGAIIKSPPCSESSRNLLHQQISWIQAYLGFNV